MQTMDARESNAYAVRNSDKLKNKANLISPIHEL